MEYKFVTTAENYEDFASGRVLYNARGITSFPVRLASEVIQRCFQILEHKGVTGPYTIHDPCCGGAYLLTVIGLLHGSNIRKIYASDIQPGVLGIAEKNLSLLTAVGLERRKQQIEEAIHLYHKASHREALESANKLAGLLPQSNLEETVIFQADITGTYEVWEADRNINIVVTDLPYGDLVSWNSSSSSPLTQFFENVYKLTEAKSSVVAVIADKNQKLKHEKFKRLQSFKIGKRQVAIFEP